MYLLDSEFQRLKKMYSVVSFPFCTATVPPHGNTVKLPVNPFKDSLCMCK